MKKFEKNMSPNAKKAPAESVIERSTRISRQIIEDEGEQRKLKTERLRKSRLKKETGPLTDELDDNSQAKRKKL